MSARPAQASRAVRSGLRVAAAALLVLLAMALPACDATRSFSGGGVPIGGSRLTGRVVAAGSPSTTLGNVSVRIEATPAGGAPVSLQQTTGKDGLFAFGNVLPGAPSATVQITAVPSDPAYRAQQVSFIVTNGRTEQLVVTLPPSSFDPASAQSISLTLASPAVPSGTAVPFQAVVRDVNGKALPVLPTLVFDGNFGTLNSDGTLSIPAGISTGTGSISAYWYNLEPQTQQIHVDNNASVQPPSPPVLPKSQDPMVK